MTLEIRTTDDPKRQTLHDGDEWIGEILEDLDDEGIALGEDPIWSVTVWSVMGTGKQWHAEGESREDAEEGARELYEEFVAERRELSKGSRIWTTGSVPMGGKPGWRRR